VSRREASEYLVVSALPAPEAPGGVRVDLRHRRTLPASRRTVRLLYKDAPGRSLVLRLRLDTYAGYPAVVSEEVVLDEPHGSRPPPRRPRPLTAERRHLGRLLARLRALLDRVNP
jgi:hypothetical protein